MRAEAASVFHRERDKDVGSSMDPNDKLRRDAVRHELHVFGMLGNIARDGRGIREDRVPVYIPLSPLHQQPGGGLPQRRPRRQRRRV